jgi:uncharacterized SAM-binding protein YcdF (DUF218 family)
MIVGVWLMPLPICLVLGCCAVLLHYRRHPRAALVLAASALGLCLLSAFGPIANLLLRPLESQYPAMLDVVALDPAPQYVVVLGSGYHQRAGLPVTAALDQAAVVRLAEGVRLWRQLPGATLILSGGRIRGEAPIASGYALLAGALGVPSSALLLLDTPVDTGSEIGAVRTRVGGETVLLVTSAAHMPRAMWLAKSAGVHAIAAPTANLTDPAAHVSNSISLPSAASLRKTETALHEYLGLLAFRLGLP